MLGPEFKPTLVCKLTVLCSTESHSFDRLYIGPNYYVWDFLYLCVRSHKYSAECTAV